MENFMNLKLAASLVPKCDGSLSSLYTFIDQARTAEARVNPQDKENLFKIIKSKLEGQAAQILRQYKGLNSINELVKILKSHFLPVIDVGRSHAELLKVKQFKGEKILAYGCRVYSILENALETAKETYTERQMEGVKLALYKSAIFGFIQGMSDKIEARIISSIKPSTLQEVIKLAERAECEQEGLESIRNTSDTHLDQVYFIKKDNTTPKSCYQCKKVGHIKSDCPEFRPESSLSNHGRKRPKVECSHCNKREHLEKRCFLKYPHLITG